MCELLWNSPAPPRWSPRQTTWKDNAWRFPLRKSPMLPVKSSWYWSSWKKWEVFRRICFRLWSQLPKHYKYEGRIRVSLSMYAALKFWMSLRLLAYFGVEWCRMRSSYVRGMSVTVYLLAIQGSPRCPNSRIRGQWRKAPTWTCL